MSSRCSATLDPSCRGASTLNVSYLIDLPLASRSVYTEPILVRCRVTGLKSSATEDSPSRGTDARKMYREPQSSHVGMRQKFGEWGTSSYTGMSKGLGELGSGPRFVSTL
ncbi:hypothetical protein TNCV_2232121 [Trichonephila clavipes]|nr:hypothetical protein TNCV_2232121 [Trichonephila clavipes]